MDIWFEDALMTHSHEPLFIVRFVAYFPEYEEASLMSFGKRWILPQTLDTLFRENVKIVVAGLDKPFPVCM